MFSLFFYNKQLSCHLKDILELLFLLTFIDSYRQWFSEARKFQVKWGNFFLPFKPIYLLFKNFNSLAPLDKIGIVKSFCQKHMQT